MNWLILSALLITCVFEQTKQNKFMKYFNNPKEAVATIKLLLKSENWNTLAEYYNIENTSLTFEIISKKDFFIRDIPSEVHHPSEQITYLRPFDPSYNYERCEEVNGRITVWVSKKIDQGDGNIQVGLATFELIRSEKGLQLIP